MLLQPPDIPTNSFALTISLGVTEVIDTPSPVQQDETWVSCELTLATQKLQTDALRQLRKIGLHIRKSEGAVLFREGERCRGAFLIRSGRIRLSFEGSKNFYPPRILGRGRIVGLPATVSGGAYTLTAEVAADARVDWIPRQKLLTFLRQEPKVGAGILRLLSEEIFRMRKAVKAAAPHIKRRRFVN